MALIETVKSQIGGVLVEEVDVTTNPAVAVKYRVMSTPALAINGRLEFTGIPRADALLARLQSAAGGSGGGSA